MENQPEGNIPLIDVFTSGHLLPDTPKLASRRIGWSLFAPQSPGAPLKMPGVSGEGDYYSIVGPVIAKTTKNTLLAFAEGRRNDIDDFGDMDIVLRRSADFGRSWSDMQIVYKHGDGQIGNPCPIVDSETGRIYLLSCTSVEEQSRIITGSSYREVWFSYSDDDGVTWSKRRNISSMARKDDWYWYATGPAAGIQIQSGKYKGRLVAPANHSYLKEDGTDEVGCHSIYSDDRGKSWKIGSASEPGGDENQIAEVGEDLLIQDIRLQKHRTGYRAYRYSHDGGETWDEMRSDESRPCTKTQGSIISLSRRPDGKHNILVTCNTSPIESRRELNRREHLVARMSTDGGKTWPKSYVVEPASAGYNTLVEIDEYRIGVFYHRHPRLSFRTFYTEDFKLEG